MLIFQIVSRFCSFSSFVFFVSCFLCFLFLVHDGGLLKGLFASSPTLVAATCFWFILLFALGLWFH